MAAVAARDLPRRLPRLVGAGSVAGVAALTCVVVGSRVDLSFAWAAAHHASGWLWSALAASVLLVLLAPALVSRAAVPDVPLGAHLLMGPIDALLAMVLPSGPAVSMVAKHRMLTALGLPATAAGGAANLVALSGAALAALTAGAAAVVLGAGGHLVAMRPPWAAVVRVGAPVLLLVTALALVGWVRSADGWPARAWSSFRTLTREAGVRRGPHVLAGQAMWLAAQCLTLLLLLAGLQGQEHPLTIGALVEAAAVFVLAHSLSWVPVLPTPLGVIDLAVLLGLAGVGVDPAVAGATVLLWRTATLLSLLAASVLALVLWRTGWRQRWQPRAGPGEAVLGRLAHRGLFALIAAVPSSWRDRLRRLIFEHTFSAEDPWRYAQMPYEARKAEALLEAVTQRPGVVIELGCAQGHLTTRLASAFPEAQVVGVDLSPTALESARQRTRLLGNCEFLLADAGGLHRTWGRRPPADLLVVSEVLYYLGGARRVAEAMAGVAPALGAGARVLLLHPDSDAPSLHAAAVGALEARHVTHRHYSDPQRPFTITTAERPGCGVAPLPPP